MAEGMSGEERLIQWTKIAIGLTALALMVWHWWPEEPEGPKFGFRRSDD